MIGKSDAAPRKVKIKKVKGHGGHHGGSWKVAYADFVTAMMALFMVLWLTSQGDQKLKQQIANYFRAPGVFDTIRGGIVGGDNALGKDIAQSDNDQNQKALFKAANLLNEKFSSLPEFAAYKDQIKIDVTKEGLRIQIIDKAEQVMFELGSSELKPTTRAILDEIARAICDLPNAIVIGGHTDAHPYPSNSYTNWELSADRANAARRGLVEACVNPKKVHRVIGYADMDLLDKHNPLSPANRRISIVLLAENAPDAAPTEDPEKPKPHGDNGELSKLK